MHVIVDDEFIDECNQVKYRKVCNLIEQSRLSSTPVSQFRIFLRRARDSSAGEFKRFCDILIWCFREGQDGPRPRASGAR